MQTGIIAFRRESLIQFNSMDETKLERIESVDLNRVLETGGRVMMVPTDVFTLGVDTPEELDEAQKLMQVDKYVSSYLFKQPGKS
jgi:3-deoxy-manno-octulosonate cytidylyltransferase (CMP-KDO synthetase)